MSRKQEDNQHSFKRSILETKFSANWYLNGIKYVTCKSTIRVSDLGFPSRGTMCPSQQFSGGHFSFLRDTKFVTKLI